ncbi:hypothetical protein FRB94_001306 [Tulasnella sp. JGI-2019a]|nr:hypothetical protein FRB94_001306 [Tulasnella sp. JGI-2019a]
MPSARRQPLSELPLALYVVTDKSDRQSDRKAVESKSPSKAKLLSPPKRRILAAEGLASPSKTPARCLLFRSMVDDMTSSNSLAGLLGGAGGLDEQQSNLGSSATQHTISSPSSFLSVASSTTLISSPTATIPSPSKLSIGTTTLPGTPPNTRSRTRSLAPSPELTESPTAREFIPGPLSVGRPTTLKRLRSGGSRSSSANPPTPKRRHLALDGPLLEFGLNEDDEDPWNDKENVPPPKKKKTTVAKSGLADREQSLTPRAGKQRGVSEQPSLEQRRARRAALEAEVDEPNNMEF